MKTLLISSCSFMYGKKKFEKPQKHGIPCFHGTKKYIDKMELLDFQLQVSNFTNIHSQPIDAAGPPVSRPRSLQGPAGGTAVALCSGTNH